MPLQIRRGTTSQRLSITPLVSELVYDTTTKLVYVGDGVTAGGIAIDQDSSPDFPLGDLSDIALEDVAEGDILRYDGTNWVNEELSLNSLDAVTITTPANNDIIKFNGTSWVNSGLSFSTLPGVNLNSPEVNQVLKFNGTSWSNENEDSSLLVTALDDLTDVVINELVTDQVLRYNGTNWVNDNESVSDLSDLETVVITDPVSNQFLKYDGANWVNSNVFDGDVTGSVFADDSTMLIDGTNGELVGPVNTSLVKTPFISSDADNLLTLTNNLNDTTSVTLNIESSTGIAPAIRFTKINDTGDLSASNIQYGRIPFERRDANGVIATSIIAGGSNFLLLSNRSTLAATTLGEVYPEEGSFIIKNNSNFGFGTGSPSENAKVDINGIMKLRLQTVAPSVGEAGMIAVADGNTAGWDPKGTNLGVSYPVFYNGSAWVPFF